MVRCVLRVLVTIPACSHQRPERHAHCRVWDDGVPVLQVEPIHARLRQLRVVVQELGQDSDEVVTPRGDPALWTRAKTKAQIRAKRTTERAIHRTKDKTTSVISKKICPAREFIPITVLINPKIFKPHRITVITVLINSKTIKSAPRISVIIFGQMVEEGVSVFFRLRPLTFFVKGRISRVVVVFLGVTCWKILMPCLMVSLRLGRMCLRCLL